MDLLDIRHIVKIDKEKTFIHLDGIKYYDILLEHLDLNTRAKNALDKEEIYYISQIINKNSSELMDIPNMGEKTVLKLRKYILSVKLIPVGQGVTLNSITNEMICIEIYDKIKYTKVNIQDLVINLSEMLELYLDKRHDLKDVSQCMTDEYFITELSKNCYIRELFKQYILSQAKESCYGITKEYIANKICGPFNINVFIDDILNILCDDGSIVYIDGLYRFNGESFIDGLKNILGEKEYSIFIKRTENITLEDIGKPENVSRERIRQIEARIIKKIISSNLRFREDVYFDIINRYDIKDTDFIDALNLPNAYYYIELRFKNKLNDKHKKQPLSDLLEDYTVPIYIRRCFEKVVYRGYILLDNKYIYCNRENISNYVLKKYALDTISFDEFRELYFSILAKIDKLDDTRLNLIDRGYMNRLSSSNMILWNVGKKFRYYDIESYDFTDLLDTLDLNQYKDVEYSTLKFFNLYPDIMQNYNIRDRYELHNLLKKICNKDEYPNLFFGRMPHIKFGNSNKNKQAEDLLLALSPISGKDFAKEYENEYGIDRKTVLACLMGEFDKYYTNGIYKFDKPRLPEHIIEKFREILVDDFYTLDEIKQAYIHNFPNNKSDSLCSLSIRLLGFRIFSTYVIRDKFASAAEYFNKILLSDDIVDTSTFHSKQRQLMSYATVLGKLRSEYQIIEFMPHKYISLNKLNCENIYIEDIRSFVSNAIDFLGNEKYFTIYSVRKAGFSHNLDELGLDDWFYTSVLSAGKNNNVYSLRVGGTKLLTTKVKDILFEDFIEFIVLKRSVRYLEIYEIQNILKYDYNIKVNISTIVNSAKKSNMFYDVVSQKLYIDYDTYFKEV